MHSSGQFQGNERFVVRRRLGAGGMGEVYEVYDRQSRQVLALKTLLRADAAAIYRFKREFRALADVTHPNLVSLYELIAEGDSWFFTMELVDGVNFLEHVWKGDATGEAFSTLDGTAPTTPLSGLETATSLDDDATPEPAVPVSPVVPAQVAARLDRLRPALRQLAEGVHALHEIGRLHRDLKPSNVLVTAEHRVVILDFGLVTDVLSGGTAHSLVVAGTPAYMAPEQGIGQTVSEASDWYSVGIMLYEALIGRPPFTGRFLDVLNQKLKLDPPAPSALVEDVPPDLDALCLDLLRRDASRRPPGAAILERLGRDPAGAPRIDVPPIAARAASFVGRDLHLAALDDAFVASSEGRTVTVYVHGPSGMGKTTLVRHFLERLQARKRAVVLEGRCFERETVPYKALDGLVDSLSRYLLALPRSKADALMPRDVPTLSRLFPVLLRVESVAGARQREQPILDPQELRRRAFASLAELLSRIAERRSLALHIDDLQWADADSLVFLEDLMRSPNPTPLLLIASFRSEELDSKPFLKALLGRADGDRRRELSVGALTPEEARGLTVALLGADALHARPFVDSLVREAGGSPFLVEQLARYAQAREAAATTGISLAQMLEGRLALLPPGARPLLETLAVAGRPVDARLAHEAAGLEHYDHSLIAALRAAQLVRSSGSAEQLEPYHDRIRETLTSLLAPEAVRRIHRRLAEAFEARSVDNPEALFEHYLGGGDRERGAAYAALAARKASVALAFDRAALLYRRALELSGAKGPERIELQAGLGEALANAGRSAEAASMYLEAAADASSGRSLEFQRRAAEQLLMSGHIDEGLRTIRAVLAAVGMKLPPTPGRALLSMLGRRLLLRLRGLGFGERHESEVPTHQLLRIDICWAVAVGLALVDIIRAADFQTRHLLLALRAGEPYRIARALAVEAGFVATAGGPARKRVAMLSARAEELSRRVGRPHALGLCMLTEGIAAFCLGEWRRGAERCEQAQSILREQCTGVAWEMTNAHSFLLDCLVYLGEIREVSRRLPALLADLREQGNLYGITQLLTRSHMVWLAADDPGRARNEVSEAVSRWSHSGFYLQHYNFQMAMTQISLYEGDGAAAWARITGEWRALGRSRLLRVQMLRAEATHLRARSALAIAARTIDPQAWLRTVERLAGRIEREGMRWSDPLALLLRAAVASRREDEPEAAALLSSSVDGFAREEMGLYAAVARRRLGRVLGGAEGGRLVAEADAWMREQGTRRPDLMTRMLAPGFRNDDGGER